MVTKRSEGKSDAEAGFRVLEITDWRQFDSVRIEFHPRLTVLTGANATGKSTILGILARHFNWQRSFSSAPIRRSSLLSSWSTLGRRRAVSPDRGSAWIEIGSLIYGSGVHTTISVPQPADPHDRTSYDLLIPAQQNVAGVFLTSHRTVSGNYAPVNTIPAIFGDANQIFEQFTNEVRTRWIGSWTGKTPQQALKEALIAAAVFGNSGNESLDFNPEAAEIWAGFQSVMREIVPKSLRFKGLRVRVPDVIVETDTGDFILDDASGGLSALIEISWQIFLRARTETNFTVLLDEPENHLHPSLQREIMPSLLRAFPDVQFIVASHSPFVVTSAPDSAVYALDYDDAYRVYARRLDYANKAASANDTLMRVLGVESAMPKWAEHEFREIVGRYMGGGLNAGRLRNLRNELREFGLESEFPDAVLRLTDGYGENGLY
ncbi:AAA family ATPase [Rhodococcus triatomae]|nr:ATP-dependent OLD family endonuclease [Rhodococcus triatomae BKS 15-14]